MTWVCVAGLLILPIYVQATNGCSRKERILSCELVLSSNVSAAHRHRLGHKDNAYAYNNLVDMCVGGQASRSSYQCVNGHYAPGGSVCLSKNLLKYLIHLKNSGRVVINELAGGCHLRTLGHYSGRGVDLKKDIRHWEYLVQCSRLGGYALNMRYFVHCHF